MQKKESNAKRTIEFLKWIQKYSGWWHLICTPNDPHMNLNMMKMLLERLYRESFYEIIFVLLTVHKNQPFMNNFSEYFLLSSMIEYWDEDKERIIQSMIEYLE
ncbi:MAG: hypothetical protein HFE39_04280 [Clostridiales bacterium]|jgi:hypothetical protein|nr:hypothetical protein [Clostridiales bacterium]